MSEPTSEGGEEECVRCGEVEEDRRTFYMACFYAMEELKLPFEQVVLFHADLEKLEKAKEAASFTAPDGTKITLRPGTVTTSGELTPHTLFTLRVCKDCRADWMEAIQKWFLTKPESKESVGSGIFVRRNGTNVEVTREEWERLQRERTNEKT